ncbi:MAG: potassium transporter TrkG [Sphingobacteriaceae bacterium]|nr:potassium transporter TrkG [Sphingobacteriaceae bacterium]
MGLLATREKILLFVYQNKEPVLRALSWLRTLASLLVLTVFLYYYGFPHPPERLNLLVGITKSIFGFFVLSYVIRVIFAIHSWQYIRNSLFEAALIVLLLFDIISVFLFGFNALENLFLRLNIENFTPFYILFIQSYLLLLVGLEVTKVSTSIPSIKLKPATTFIYSFLLLLLIGTGLLMLPEMTTAKGSMPFIDALFTAVSAACVTGLAVVDTATYFTFKGHLVILLLFQLGGIGILTFATFFALFLKKGVGISHQAMIRDFMSEDSLFNAKGMLRQIVVFTLLIESIGAFLLYLLWDVNAPFYDDTGEMIFQSVFHAISAFCNAGFSLMSNGLNQDYLQNAYILHIVIGVLIIFGSLGFPAMRDIFGIKNIRARMAAPWKRWKLSTRIAVWASFALIIFGMVVFYLLEYNGVLAGKSSFERFVIAFFQSVTTRTAGFNTVAIGALSTPTAILFIFLMFIGASSGSTGGGIKTSTFVLIFLSVITTIRGKKSLELGGRSISFDLLNKAFTIFIFSATYILMGTFFLAYFEPKMSVLDLVFEQVSAFCTVGLTRGITPDLSTPSKLILISSMYIGRVGTLTLAFALASRVDSTNYRYPKAHILVG